MQNTLKPISVVQNAILKGGYLRPNFDYDHLNSYQNQCSMKSDNKWKKYEK